MTNARPERVETGAVLNVPGGHEQDSAEGHQEANSGDLLRQLSRGVLDGPRHAADQRVADAAIQAAAWVSRKLIDRTAAITVLSVAAQAVGIGQDEALAVIRAALWAGGAE